MANTMNGINGLNMMWFLPISGTLLYISHGLMIVSINPKVGVAGMVLYFFFWFFQWFGGNDESASNQGPRAGLNKSWDRSGHSSKE